MAQTPRLRRILRALFYALAVLNLTLAEALFFLRSHDPDGIRQSLTSTLPDATYDFVWRELNALSRREFAEMTESTVSRVTAFLDSPAVRLMVGQQAHALDFRRAMDEGRHSVGQSRDAGRIHTRKRTRGGGRSSSAISF